MKNFLLFAALIFITFLVGQINAQTPGTIKWSIFLGNQYAYSIGHLTSPAVGPDGIIYAAYYELDYYSEPVNGKLYAINPDGTAKWDLPILPAYGTVPAVDTKGNIYIGTIYDSTGYGPLYSINPDGSINWTINFDYKVWGTPGIHEDGTIYVGGEYLRAINPDGSLKWSWDAHPPGIWSGSANTPPVFSTEGMIYVGWNRHPGDDYLNAFYPDKDETTYKSFKIDIGAYTSPMLDEAAIDNDGTIYISTQSSPGVLIAINPDLTEKWRCEIATDSNLLGGSPAIGADGTVYVPGGQGVGLTAVSHEGAIKWNFENARGTPAIGNDGTLYVSGTAYVNFEWKHYLLALNPDGTQKWASEYIGPFSEPTLSNDGTVYLLSSEGYLYAFYSSSQGIGKTPWPMYRHDPQHTGQAVSGTFNQKPTAVWNTLLLSGE